MLDSGHWTLENAIFLQKRNNDEKREEEYNKLNQFEMQFDDKVNNTTTWVDKINEIKAKYPKP